MLFTTNDFSFLLKRFITKCSYLDWIILYFFTLIAYNNVIMFYDSVPHPSEATTALFYRVTPQVTLAQHSAGNLNDILNNIYCLHMKTR